MSMLNDRKIKEYCEKNKMIEPYNKKRIKSASYDISVGDEYRFSHEKDVKKLCDWEIRIEIAPYSICYVLTKETLNLPNNVSAHILPRHRTVREGLLMYPQPPIDPGYKGKLYVLIHNLTNKIRIIEKDEHLASVVFYELGENAETPYGKHTDDTYQNVKTLKDLGLGTKEFNPYTSALKEISGKVKNWREGLLSKWIPILLILMTIFLMALSIIFAIFAWRN